jgi:uncharacterized membrane protein
VLFPLPSLSAPSALTSAHRVIFIDLARAMAVLFMLYGHTISALLAPSYQAGGWFAAWQFQRGLTACLFLMLSGFSFSVATTRHWASHVRPSWAILRRLRRFAWFIVLGYALHFPVADVAELAALPEERWRTFLAVDVLQLIGVSLMVIQLLVLALASPRVFAFVSVVLAAAVTSVTPIVWRTDWTARLPLGIAAYLSPATGSLFPIFPWAAYILVGAALGEFYSRWGAGRLQRFLVGVLLMPGAVLVAAALTVRGMTGGTWSVPSEVLLRSGACLLILSVIAFVSRRLSRLPHVFGAVAQETLLIYWVHLCIVYGSVWNPGLSQAYGATLGPLPVIGLVVALVASMVTLAWYWNQWKHTSPRTARWAAVATGGLLAAKLL